MKLSTKHLHKHLVSNGVESVFHANSVYTSCHFLEHSALLSRGQIEDRCLCQTSQYTDGKDREVGVWHDVFVDSCDIHSRKNAKNSYGPVILEFDVSLINESCDGNVWVTRNNPADWEVGDKENSRWFSSSEEIFENFNVFTFAQMIVFRDCDGQVPFANHLRRILLDDPQRTDEDGNSVFDLAAATLAEFTAHCGIDVPIEKRGCSPQCKCVSEYEVEDWRSIEKYFLDRCPG